MIRTLQIQDREISDANSYFVAKHGVITHSSGFWGNVTSITLKRLLIYWHWLSRWLLSPECLPTQRSWKRPASVWSDHLFSHNFQISGHQFRKKPGNWCINEIYFKIYEIYLKIEQIFSNQVCICPSFADTNIIREGMEVILQWRPPSFLILIIFITNYKSGDFCVIWDNLGKRPT